MGVPRVAALHDISGMGRCSLTAAIPILSAMGVQVCPLPTAVLSNQTGYESYAVADLSEHLPAFAAQWRLRGVRFDGIYTGFLCGPEQVEFAQRFLRDFSGAGTLTVVDPVLGDDGAVYRVFDGRMCRAVAGLVGMADVVTPNLTEACLLTHTDFAQTAGAAASGNMEPVWTVARRLAAMGPRIVVVTGVHAGDIISNACWLADEKSGFCVDTRRVGQSFSGTGDVLASVLCGGLIRGDSPQRALALAAQLLGHAVALSAADGTDRNDGVAFEPYLGLLVPQEKEKQYHA